MSGTRAFFLACMVAVSALFLGGAAVQAQAPTVVPGGECPVLELPCKDESAQEPLWDNFSLFAGTDELGVWGTGSAFGDTGHVLRTDIKVDPISQVALYWRRRWESCAETRVWIGAAEPHGTDIISFPDVHNTDMVLTLGLEVFV